MTSLIIHAGKTHPVKLQVHTWRNGSREVRAIRSLHTVALVEDGVVLYSMHSSITARTLKTWLGTIPTPTISNLSV